MCRWMIGPASPATIADMLRVEMTPIIAATVNMIIVPNVLRTVVAAMRVVVLAVPNNVPTVKIKSVWTVCRNVLNVAQHAAVHVLKKTFVQIVKKKWRKIMKTRNAKLQKQTKTEIQANLKQVKHKSSWQVEKETEHARRLTLRFSPTAWAKLL